MKQIRSILRSAAQPALRRVTAAIVCALLTLLSGCQTTTMGGAVGAERKQLLLVSSEQLDQMAREGYSALLADAREKKVLNTNAALLRRIRGIASRLEPQTKVFRADAPGWQWEVNTITSDELNAFCMPGGKIMVYSGLVTRLKLSDDEIAVVMGHEIAHALREHSREQVSQAVAAQTAIGLGATLLGLGQGSVDLASAGYQALVATRFSRNDESEADRMGLELSARAGYNPQAGVTLWQKMIAANSGGRPPEFLSSHPADARRVADVEALLPTVTPLYKAAIAH